MGALLRGGGTIVGNDPWIKRSAEVSSVSAVNPPRCDLPGRSIETPA